MKKLTKRTSINELQTVEAYEAQCICICPACSCWNDILWIGDTKSTNNEAKAFAGGAAWS